MQSPILGGMTQSFNREKDINMKFIDLGIRSCVFILAIGILSTQGIAFVKRVINIGNQIVLYIFWLC